MMIMMIVVIITIIIVIIILNLHPALYILIQKAAILSTCHTVRKFLAEQ